MATVPYIDEERCTSSIRVLVVEDHEGFRRFVCSMLDERPDLQLVCEVSDGLEAVNITAKLQPDLILLDVGLPSMNGIEAARRIRKLSPESKILLSVKNLLRMWCKKLLPPEQGVTFLRRMRQHT